MGSYGRGFTWGKGILICWILILVCLSAILWFSCASGATLVYSAPCTLMHKWKDWDEQKQDSVTNLDCTPGDSAREQIIISLLWRAISPSSQFQTVAQHVVPPCREDSFINQGPGHYYLMARNSAGPGLCGSGQVTVLPGIMTSVETVEQPKFQILYFDIHGRLVTKKGVGVVTYKKKVRIK